MKYKLLLTTLLLISSITWTIAQCNYTVSAGNDTTLCSSVGVVQLNAVIGGTPPSAVTYNWLPATGLNNPTSASPTATVNSSMTYVVEAYSAGTTNLVTNGDFSSGNTGFTTDYVVGTGGTWGPLSNPGTYAIATNASATHTNFAACTDHTSGTGNMMVVNGASTANQDVWCQTVTVLPNTYYLFETWLTSVENTNPASLQFSINGNSLGAPFNASATTCTWQAYNQIWFSGAATNAQICIVNQNTNGSGNDFALDDIIFNEVCVVRDTIVVNKGLQSFITVDTTICQGNSYFAGGQFQTTAGTYADFLQDQVGCDSVVITNLTVAPTTISLGNDTVLCGGQSLLLNVGFPGATYTWQDGSNDSTFNITQSGIYWVTADLGTCVLTDTIQVTFNTAPPLELGNDTSICLGNFITYDVSDTSITSYNWYNGATTPVLIIGTSDTVWVTVSNSAGCTSSDTVVVTAYAVPMPDFGADTTLCEGDTLLLDATLNGSTYQWQDNSANPTFTVTQSGIYHVEVNNGGICTGRDTIQVTFNPQPPLDIGNDTTICQGNLVTYDVSDLSIQTYQWNNSTVNPILVVSTGGTYAVTVTDPVGCANSDSAIVTVLPYPNTDLGNDTTICAGQTLVLDATFAGATYQWQDNSTGSTFSVTQSGAYWVTVSNGICVSSDTINVTVNPIPPIDLGNDTIICTGDLVQLDATYFFAQTYAWNNSVNTPILVVGNQGTYAVTVTDAAGCWGADSIMVTVLQRPNIDFGADTSICDGATLLLDATTPSSIYLWEDNSISPIHLITQAGTYWVNVSNGVCSDGDTINVAIDALPIVDIGADTLICSGASYTLDATHPDAQSYLWSTSEMTSTINVSTSGVYIVGVLDNNGCVGLDTATVTVSPTPIVFLGFDQTLCVGEATLLDATTFNATYEWQDNSTNPTFLATMGGVYAVTATNPDGCTISDTIIITDAPLPNVDLGADTVVCTSVGYLLDATTSNAQSYFWQDFTTGNTLQVFSSGNYFVEVTSTDGCQTTDSINITIVFPPVLDLGQDTVICDSTTLLLNAELPLATNYLWQDGSMSSTYLVTQGGTYHALVLDQGGCVSMDSIVVSISADPAPIHNMPTDTTICNETTVVLNAYQPNARQYSWQGPSAYYDQNDYTDTTFLVTFEGDYTVTVSNGCASLRQVISVWKEDCGCYPFVPNAFTPNNDGNNDIFRVYTDCFVENYKFSIYDRWGQLVFFSEDIAEGWDGRINGSIGQNGVYVWMLEFTGSDENGEPIARQMKGDISVIR